MLRIKLILSVIFLISFSISSQNYWKPETTTSFSVLANTQITAFVDANGVHIAYYRNGGIKYALVNSNGAAINGKYDKVVEAEGSGTNYVNVAAIENNVYAIYFKNNKIQVARSTNLGDTWNNNFDNWQMSNYGCDAITAYLVGQEIHIVWTETRVNGYQPETHYIKFVPNDNQYKWQNYKKVSDVEIEGGKTPDIAISIDKVHVGYILNSPMNPKSRTRLTSGIWDTPQFVPYYEFPMASLTNKVKPIITGSYLNEIYRANYGTIGVSGSYIGHSYRQLNSSIWTQNPEIINTVANKSHLVEKTADNKIHIISFGAEANNYVHRTLYGTTISGIISNVPFYELTKKLVSNSNDLYLLHAGNTSIPYSIFICHYDAAPLAPVNPQLSANPGSGMVRFSWTKNNEADISVYEVWRKVQELGGVWQLVATTSNNYFVDPTYYYAPGAGNFGLTYKVRAKDIGDNLSDYSSEVSTRGEEMGKKVVTNEGIREYNLDFNYPNPFNPITVINYAVKEAGLVRLKVYDILGAEVAVLVNEIKEAGNHKIEFNASQLPSGVYIYTLQVNGFTGSKKMLLMK
ncbi:MAG TPA: T9SS type A sorting domain-containing protein [Ignavibacteriaceae bacterium]